MDEKRITIDLNHAQASSQSEIRNTILHEIAHARAGPRACSHGPRWQREARNLGVSERDITQHIARYRDEIAAAARERRAEKDREKDREEDRNIMDELDRDCEDPGFGL